MSRRATALVAGAAMALLMLSVAGVAWAAACDPSLCGPDGWPKVVKTVPLDDGTDVTTGVDRDRNIKATFSEAMDPGSINEQSFELVWFDSACTWSCSAGNKVAASVHYDAATRTAVLNPASRLAQRRLYYAVLWSCNGCSNVVLDDDGSELEYTHTWRFKTGRR